MPLDFRQRLIVPSSDAVNTRDRRSSNRTPVTLSECMSLNNSSPLFAFHRRAVLSREAVTATVPRKSKSAKVSRSWCPSSVVSNSPDFASQIFAFLSHDAVMTFDPSALKRTEGTGPS